MASFPSDHRPDENSSLSRLTTRPGFNRGRGRRKVGLMCSSGLSLSPRFYTRPANSESSLTPTLSLLMGKGACEKKPEDETKAFALN